MVNYGFIYLFVVDKYAWDYMENANLHDCIAIVGAYQLYSIINIERNPIVYETLNFSEV